MSAPSVGKKPYLEDRLNTITGLNAPLKLTIAAFRKAIKTFLGLQHDMPLIMNDDLKQAIRQGTDNPNGNLGKLPEAYFTISSIGLDKNQSPIKNVARNSSAIEVSDLLNRFLTKHYMFPALITVEVHYLTTDLAKALDISLRLLLAAHSGKLNCKVEIEGVEWFVTITMQSEDIPLSPAQIDTPQLPNTLDIPVTFVIATKLGNHKQTPRSNGTVTTSIEEKTHGQDRSN